MVKLLTTPRSVGSLRLAINKEVKHTHYNHKKSISSLSVVHSQAQSRYPCGPVRNRVLPSSLIWLFFLLSITINLRGRVSYTMFFTFVHHDHFRGPMAYVHYPIPIQHREVRNLLWWLTTHAPIRFFRQEIKDTREAIWGDTNRK